MTKRRNKGLDSSGSDNHMPHTCPGFGNRLSVLPQSFQMQLYSLTDVLLSLFKRFAGGNTAGQVGNIS